MKKTRHDRKVFLDQLEKKYIKKVQLHAFKRESDALKNELVAMRGARVSQVDRYDNALLGMSDYKLNYL